MKAVFLDRESLDRGDLDLSALESLCTSFTPYAYTTPEQLDARIATAEVVISNKVILNAETLARATQLKHICVAATGTNNVDIDAATRLGISVSNCQAYGVNSVAQHVMTLILALHTNLIAYNHAARNDQWANSRQFCLLDYPIDELAGKKLGIVGYGNLGAGVARLAEAFGMQILLAESLTGRPAADRVPLADLIQEADVISLHCPLTEQTRNLFDADVLRNMKPGAYLINAARGGIVNEGDLADALRSGHLAGAATDVLTEEPPVHGNPLLADDIPNLIITPHCAWGSVQARQKIVAQMAETLTGLQNGIHIRVVNSVA